MFVGALASTESRLRSESGAMAVMLMSLIPDLPQGRAWFGAFPGERREWVAMADRCATGWRGVLGGECR